MGWIRTTTTTMTIEGWRAPAFVQQERPLGWRGEIWTTQHLRGRIVEAAAE